MTAVRSAGAIMGDFQRPTEHQDQRALIEWWALEHRRWELPEFALYSVPNGGVRHAATAGRLKAEGLRRGIPDLVLAVPRGRFHGAYLEMKRVGGDGPSHVQVEVGKYLTRAGYAHHVAHGFDEARAWLRAYLEGAATA